MYLLGWKAMPLAREDLDSNCGGQRAIWCAVVGTGVHALVNMEGDDMAVVRAKPQLQAARTASIGRSNGSRLAGGLCIRRRKRNRVGESA